MQAAHIIDNLRFFESNGVFILLCTFENKDVHAIDYASGDILHQFIFKDDITNEEEIELEVPKTQNIIQNKIATFKKNRMSHRASIKNSD